MYQPKCSRAGLCVGENWCDTDADCRGDYKFCDTLHACEPCLADADCPSETPVCVPGWEFGLYCAVCRVGDSTLCPAGTVCSPMGFDIRAGTCEPPNCAEAPEGKACVACVAESSPACVGADGECSDLSASVDACYRTQVPEACFDEWEALDACLRECPVVVSSCGT